MEWGWWGRPWGVLPSVVPRGAAAPCKGTRGKSLGQFGACARCGLSYLGVFISPRRSWFCARMTKVVVPRC